MDRCIGVVQISGPDRIYNMSMKQSVYHVVIGVYVQGRTGL